VGSVAGPLAAIDQLAGTSLRVRNQLAQRIHRQPFAHDHEIGHGSEICDRHEFFRLVGQLLIEALVCGERRRCRDQERIAIGFRLRHQRSTDVAAAAAAVLYDDRLAPLRLQLVADDSGKHVVGAAAGIRNEKFYRSCRIGVLSELRVGPWRGNHRKDEDEGEGEGGKPSDHGDLHRNPGLPGFRSIVNPGLPGFRSIVNPGLPGFRSITAHVGQARLACEVREYRRQEYR
jgi:hypothetical protein